MPGQAQILVVDDDAVTRSLLAGYLEKEGYAVSEAGSVEQAREVLAGGNVDVVLLDIRLPGADGLTLTRELRAESEIGIILITGSKKDNVDRIVGLELGADDYVLKPFNAREIVARVKNLLRRVAHAREAARAEDGPLRFLGWRMEPARRRLFTPDEEEVPLTEGEFRLLDALIRHGGRVVSRAQLLDHLQGRDWSPSDRSVDVLIGRLRRKLRDDSASPRFIMAVRGVGYRFIPKIVS
ncbi:MAG TPA: response regulator [Woeseiaceae bacterium]|nr:response regulator [Woeseiaceae bacterium]